MVRTQKSWEISRNSNFNLKFLLTNFISFLLENPKLIGIWIYMSNTISSIFINHISHQNRVGPSHVRAKDLGVHHRVKRKFLNTSYISNRWDCKVPLLLYSIFFYQRKENEGIEYFLRVFFFSWTLEVICLLLKLAEEPFLCSRVFEAIFSGNGHLRGIFL